MTSRGLAVAVALCACAGFQPTVKQDPAPSLPRPQRPASAPGGTAFAEARPASVWSSGMPLTLPAASDLCRATGCWLPTAKIVDALYAQASLKLEPRPIPPSAEMMSNAYFLDHQNRVQAQLDSVVDGHTGRRRRSGGGAQEGPCADAQDAGSSRSGCHLRLASAVE